MADSTMAERLSSWRSAGRPVIGQPPNQSTTSPKLTAPLIMFNALVESFSSSVGYGAESSTMQMTLVEDPENGRTIKHSPDGGVTSVDGFPAVGTCCQFVFEGFEFVGIFQRYNYTQGIDGRRYDVTFESPSKVLGGVQVILNGFEGTAFSGNYPIYPSVDETNFTSQINNVYNPFGVKENYSWGGNFGYSDYNESGFPVTDDDSLPGIAGKGLLTLIEEISQSKFTYDNPDGPAADTSFNSDDEELIGGPIHFGNTKYTIDFGELKTLVPEWDDTKVADAEKKLVLEWASTTGKFTKEELDNAYDARAVATMRKAMKYDQLKEKRKSLKPVQRQNLRAGSQSGEPSKLKAGKAAQRLKKSGSVEDAAGVFYNMIRSK